MAAVAVHHGRLDLPAGEVDRLSDLLAPEERDRAARFRFARDRRRFVVRRARPSGAGDRYLGNDEPVDPRLSAHLGRHGVRDERERARLAAEATAYDAYMMSHPQTETGYGVEADLDVDGILVVEVAGQDEMPLVLASAPWARQGVVAYRIHWEPADFVELELERPSLAQPAGEPVMSRSSARHGFERLPIRWNG